MNSLSHAFTNAGRGACPFLSGARNAGDTSASAAAGTVNEFSSTFSSSLNRSGYRRPGSRRHCEDLLHGRLEPQERDYLPREQVDHADAARPLFWGEPLGDRDAAEAGALAHLR